MMLFEQFLNDKGAKIIMAAIKAAIIYDKVMLGLVANPDLINIP